MNFIQVFLKTSILYCTPVTLGYYFFPKTTEAILETMKNANNFILNSMGLESTQSTIYANEERLKLIAAYNIAFIGTATALCITQNILIPYIKKNNADRKYNAMISNAADATYLLALPRQKPDQLKQDPGLPAEIVEHIVGYMPLMGTQEGKKEKNKLLATRAQQHFSSSFALT
jgi:hypothetical protein